MERPAVARTRGRSLASRAGRLTPFRASAPLLLRLGAVALHNLRAQCSMKVAKPTSGNERATDMKQGNSLNTMSSSRKSSDIAVPSATCEKPCAMQKLRLDYNGLAAAGPVARAVFLTREGSSVMRLTGKVSIITGAGQGIGRATALKFA